MTNKTELIRQTETADQLAPLGSQEVARAFGRTVDLSALRDAIIRLMRVHTPEGLDRSPFALALHALDDIIDMVNAGRHDEEAEALEWLAEHLKDARVGLLRLMRENPLGREPREVVISEAEAPFTSVGLEEFYEWMDSRPLEPGEKAALAGFRILLEHAQEVVRYACLRTDNFPDGSKSWLQGALADFCMRWQQKSEPVVQGLIQLFPDLEDLIKEALGGKGKQKLPYDGNRPKVQRPSFKGLIDLRNDADQE
jgi:hypothetical protein